MAKVLYLINKENELNSLIKTLSELKTDMHDMNEELEDGINQIADETETELET